ncbi:MAG TPA: acyltransferase family protein [Baekduia sp.]|uniref:acyltransferase family protein n=1 Tax=Baekduia sp. TaxID=2600305 RepID=UPI002D79AE3E|nr:acyltransferase family protein [Baekduia sp.]HET6506048.1 acyltransferase family protein [Baekduia sp.]
MDVTALRRVLVGVPASRDVAPPRARTTEGIQPAPARHGIRPEIQALRALAVSLVVAWHLWPDDVPGGFVGVDVFFAISGYLITSLLLRELEATGRVSLRDFWARRARRILPAALTVVACCAAATALVVPLTDWQGFFGDFRASTLYVQNWHLAAEAVDYFHADDAPSPVQHFWSLAVEEQFYLVWPVLLLLARRRAAVTVLAVVLAVASLGYSVAHTADDPADAYFATTTRGWELGAGALLALLPVAAAHLPRAARVALASAGLAAIGVAAATYSTGTAFPGVAAALPVLGTVAVIGAGDVLRPLRARPVQQVGDLSYAIYLWHWPLIVLAPYALGHALDTPTRLAIIMLTLLLSLLSQRLVEDPIRFSRRLSAHGGRLTFAGALAASLAVLAIVGMGADHVRAEVHQAALVTRKTLAHKPKCFGAAARDPKRTCTPAKLSKTVVPTPVQAPKMDNAPCEVVESKGRIRVCAFGAAAAPGVRTVALIGDSHASHWRSAMAALVKDKGWRGLSITHTSCPYSAATAVIDEPARGQCVEWKRQLAAWLRRHHEVDTVFFGAHSGGEVVAPKGRTQWSAQVDGYVNAWKALPSSVAHIMVFRDTPKMRSATMDCVQSALDRHRNAGKACAQPRARALERDPEAVAARSFPGRRVHLIDVTRYICDASRCYPVVGGALVFKDIHHLTSVFAESLAPYVERQVDAAGIG